jgi:hypothetical protein
MIGFECDGWVRVAGVGGLSRKGVSAFKLLSMELRVES